jgi:phage terminase Nu1 subunit (DNA packaging protein)
MKITGQEQIAQAFGVAPKTIVEWQERGFPIATQGKRGVSSTYDLPACIEWFASRAVKKAGAEDQRTRLNRLQADEVEMRIAEKRGQLIPVELIEPAWMAVVTSARSFLRSEPDRLAHLVETIEGVDGKRDLLSETFDDFLTKLSTFDPDAIQSAAARAAASGAPGGREVGAAAEDIGGPVG